MIILLSLFLSCSGQMTTTMRSSCRFLLFVVLSSTSLRQNYFFWMQCFLLLGLLLVEGIFFVCLCCAGSCGRAPCCFVARVLVFLGWKSWGRETEKISENRVWRFRNPKYFGMWCSQFQIFWRGLRLCNSGGQNGWWMSQMTARRSAHMIRIVLIGLEQKNTICT